MKKIILALIMLLSFVTVRASTNDTEVEVRLVPNVYYNYKKGDLIYWGQFGYIYANGKIAYCYDIGRAVSTNIYSSSSNVITYGNTPLIVFFGYGYKDNNTLEDYMATQQLIWKEQGISVYYTNRSGGEGDVIDVSVNKDKILNYVNSYGKFPSFQGLFKFDLGTSNIIKDSSNILNDFKISNSSNNTINIDNNNLIIDAYSQGDFSFSLTTKYVTRFENKVLTASNSQTLIQIGMINNMFNRYYYSVSGGTLEINLYDKYTNSILNSGSSTFKGNLFELYDCNNELIGTYETMEDGKIYIDNLSFGLYTLKHILTSDGYNIDNNEYKFEIKFNYVHKNIDVYLEPKIIEFKIRKSFGNPNTKTTYYDDNVKFDVINSNGDIVQESYTYVNGECSLKLVFDDYVIKQINTNMVNEISPDYIISKENFINEQDYEIYTPIYGSRMKIYLYKKGTDTPIENAKFIINNKEYITNDLGYFITDYLDEGSYSLRQEYLEDYTKIDDLNVSLDSEQTFYLENNESYVDLLIYNEENIVEDSIDNEIINDNDVSNDVNESIIVKDEENVYNKLPNLGLYNIKYIYMLVIVFRLKNVKKNNT